MKLRTLSFALATVALLSPLSSTAQTALSQAIALFEKGQYEQTRQILASTAKEDERDAKVNFYYGAAEAMTGNNLSDALRRLHLAQLRSFRRNDANLFIGRANQLLCEYDQARAAFAKFCQTCKDDSLLNVAKGFDAECQNSISLASKVFNLRVAGKSVMPRTDAANAYAASKECGSVCKNSRFFQSDIDPDGLMYMTERADAVYFSVPDDDGYLRLMKMEKLIGGWSEMSPLRGLDGEWNDIAPVLMTDGVTIFFASDRPGGFGGYDIYKTTYDAENRTYTEPVNMGIPFNSPFDDFLLFPDEFNGRAWFSSQRENVGTDSITVYEVQWSSTLVRSTANTTADILAALDLTPDPELQPVSSNSSSRTSAQTVTRDRSFVPRDAFKFQVCDSLTYTQWEHFRSQQAASAYRQVVSAQAERDSLISLMAQQRKDFMALSSSLERNTKLQELLRTERSIYSLEDEISDKAEVAKNAEIREITRLIDAGQYTPLNKIKVSNPNAPKLTGDAWLRPESFSVYSPVFFRDARAEEDDEVLALFTEQQRILIHNQDSMLAWARIVSLEATSLDAKALSSETSDDDAVAYAAKADAYRMASARLSSDAYDRLFEIYNSKYKVIIATLDGYDYSELNDLCAKAKGAMLSASADDIEASDAAKREEALAAKRHAVAYMVKCMQRYSVHADGSFPLPLGDGSTTAPASTPAEPDDTAEPATQPAEQQTTMVEQPAQTEAEPAQTGQGEISLPYRIQLGAFRKRPEALSQLPDADMVSSVFIEERGITRYYYGFYASATDASSDILIAQKAGFSGAFAVKVD